MDACASSAGGVIDAETVSGPLTDSGQTDQGEARSTDGG